MLIREQTREVSVEGVQDAEEGGADGTLRFTRTGDLTNALTVTYTVATTGPSLATPTADYAALTGSVTFAANAATVDVSVVTTDDSVQEPDEVVLVTIAAASTYTIGAGTGQVWIEDDDGAAMYWISADDGHWRDPANWSLNREPVSGDHLYFTSSYNGSMTGFHTHTGTPTYAGLHVLAGHTGTITLTLPVTFGTLELRSEDAVIDQPEGAGSELTITSRFDWTGGTINESETASTIILDSAVGVLAPDGGNTVWTGSNINLVGGAVLTALSGTLQMLNGDLEIDVEEYCRLILDPGDGGADFVVGGGANLTQDNPILRMRANSWVELREGDFILHGRIINTAGSLHLYPNTSMHLVGTDEDRAYEQWGGVLRMWGGSALTTGGGREVDIQGGGLYIETDNELSDVRITTSYFTFAGGELTIGGVGSPHVYGTLTVNGTTAWYGGVFRPYIEGSHERSDRWVVNGDFTIDGRILTPIVVDGEDNPGPPPRPVAGGAFWKAK